LHARNIDHAFLSFDVPHDMLRLSGSARLGGAHAPGVERGQDRVTPEESG
jgi:hypothetical protein